MAFINTLRRMRGFQTGGDTARVLLDGNATSAADHDFEVWANDVTTPTNRLLRVRQATGTGDAEVTSSAVTRSLGTAATPWTNVQQTNAILVGTSTGAITINGGATPTPHTLIMPPILGAAGAVLTDTAGNGILAWTVPAAGGVTGGGASTEVAFWTGASVLAGDPDFVYETTAAFYGGRAANTFVVGMGSGATPTLGGAAQKLFDAGQGTATDFTTVNLNGAYFRAGGAGNLATGQFLMGQGTTASNHWVNIPTRWDWHFQDNDRSYIWSSAGCVWNDPTGTTGAQLDYSHTRGDLTIFNSLVAAHRRIQFDSGQDHAAAVQQNTLLVSGSNVSGDRWTISTSGNSFSGTTQLRFEPSGDFVIAPLAVTNDSLNHGLIYEPQNAFLNFGGTWRHVHIKGESATGRFATLSAGTNTIYALDIAGDLSMTGAGNNFSALHVLLVEDVASTNNPLLLDLESTSFGGSILTQATLDFDGALFIRGDYSWRSGTTFTATMAHANTATRLYTFPDAAGTMTLTAGTPVNNQIAVWTGATSVEGTAGFLYDSAGSTTLTLLTTDAGTLGPTVLFDHDSASPVAGDVVGRMIFRGEDSIGGDQDWARIDAVAQEPTTTFERGHIKFYGNRNGTLIETLQIGGDGGVWNDGANAELDFRIEGGSVPFLFYVDATTTTENIAMFSIGTPNWQAMDRGLFIGNTTTAPTGNPASGGFLYSAAGAGTWRGSGGTVTTFGPADPVCPDCGRDFVWEWKNDDPAPGHTKGHLVVCAWCLVHDLTDGGRVAKNYVRVRKTLTP